MRGVARPRVLALVALMATAPAAAAQTPAAPAAGPAVRVQALGSVPLTGEPGHVAGGALVQLPVGVASVVGLGMVGKGGEYESLLGGAGIGLRLRRLGPADVTGFAGYGVYREEGWTGIRRDAGGALLGVFGTVDLGPVALTVGAIDLVGRYSKDDVPEPFWFRVPRLTIGLGL